VVTEVTVTSYMGLGFETLPTAGGAKGVKGGSKFTECEGSKLAVVLGLKNTAFSMGSLGGRTGRRTKRTFGGPLSGLSGRDPMAVYEKVRRQSVGKQE